MFINLLEGGRRQQLIEKVKNFKKWSKERSTLCYFGEMRVAELEALE